MRPLFKKGDITEFSNYRPISLLTSFSKIIGKIIYKRLYNYLNDTNVLAGDQYGFREKLSTETAIYTLLNNVLSSLIEGILLVVYFATYKKRLTVLIMKYFWLKGSFMGSLE